jgi:hypothetical protein
MLLKSIAKAAQKHCKSSVGARRRHTKAAIKLHECHKSLCKSCAKAESRDNRKQKQHKIKAKATQKQHKSGAKAA